LKRAAFIGAASGYYLAALTTERGGELFLAITQGRSERVNLASKRSRQLDKTEAATAYRSLAQYSGTLSLSVHQLTPQPGGLSRGPETAPTPASEKTKASGEGLLTFKRKSEPKGPLAVFGYDYFAEHAKAVGVETPKLLSYDGLWGGGEEYAYEVLNFADGKRNAQEIQDSVSAEYGPVPLEMVVEYLKALEKIGIVEEVKK
jgi:hypothetical protein